MHTDPEELDVPLPDGTLRVLRWGRGPRHGVALHGITASGASWEPVAEALPTEWSLFAVDLRGRGHSADLPGPYGFGRHIEDVLAAVAHLRLEQPVLAGHSLGAYLALLTADREPGTFGGLLLIDGGLPLPVPAGVDLDALLDASLGPALARLRETFPSVEAYFDFWRAHPAMKDSWNVYLEDYLRYDLTGEDGVLRSRVSEQAVRADGRELLEQQRAGQRRAARPEPPGPAAHRARGHVRPAAGRAPAGTVRHLGGAGPDAHGGDRARRQPLHAPPGSRARGDRRPPADRDLRGRSTPTWRHLPCPAGPVTAARPPRRAIRLLEVAGRRRDRPGEVGTRTPLTTANGKGVDAGRARMGTAVSCCWRTFTPTLPPG